MDGSGILGANAPLLGVVPVLAGPLQALMALLPWILLTLIGLIFSLLRPRAIRGGLRLLWRGKWSLLGLALGLFLVVRLASLVSSQISRPTPQAGEAGPDWPMFRGGLARTGVADGPLEPAEPVRQWSWRDGSTAVYSSPAVVGNRVYVSTARTDAGEGQGRILCFDSDSGRLVWESAPPGYRATFSSPVIAGNRLLCGEGLHDTRDARVFCLDLTPGREGQLLWSYRTAGHVECTPVVDEDKVYVGAGDDGLYCFRLDPAPVRGTDRSRSPVPPELVWHRTGRDYPDAETSLAVYAGRVYAGLGHGGQAICVLDAQTGEELRRIPADYPVFSPPAIAAGRMFVGMGNGDYVHVAEELDLPPAGAVWCVDLQTLEVLWKHPVGRTVLGSPAVVDGRVYFGSRDGHLYCLDFDGRLLGTWNAYAPILASPAVSQFSVYVVSNSGMLSALDRSTLQPRWEFQAGSRPRMFSSPAIARGHVYVGSEHDGLQAIGQPGEAGESATTHVWPAPLGRPGSAGRADDEPVRDRGALRWQFPEAHDATGAAAVVAPPAIADGDLLLALAGNAAGRGVACLPLAGLEQATARWFYRTELPVVRSPVISNTHAFVVEGEFGDSPRRLHAIDRETGDLGWQVPVASDATGTLACTDRELLVQDRNGLLTCLDAGGRQLWSNSLGRIEHAPAAIDALLVVAVSDPPGLVVLDLPSGRELWRKVLDNPPSAGPAVIDGDIWLGTTARLERRSLADGSPTPSWTSEGPGVAGGFYVGREFAAYIGADGRLILLARQSGRVMGSCPGALPGRAPLVSGNRLLFLAEGSIQTVRFDGDGFVELPRVWYDTSAWIAPTTSMVAWQGQVFVGLTAAGLVGLGADP